MPYRHIFFDLDHTLWDFEHNSRAAWAVLFKEHSLHSGGTSFEEFYAVYHAHNERMWAQFRKGQLSREELRQKRVKATLLDCKVYQESLVPKLSEAYLKLLPAQNRMMPYALDLLNYLSEKYILHIITNGFETTQLEKLRNCGADGFFTEIITSEKAGCAKPDAGIFSFALDATGAAKENSLMIGDALEIDIAGALSAGWEAAYYNPARTQHSHRPTYEIDCLSRLIPLL